MATAEDHSPAAAPHRIQRLQGGYQTHYWHTAEQRLQLNWFGDTAYGGQQSAYAAALEHLNKMDSTYGPSVYRQGWRQQSVANKSGTVGLSVRWHRSRGHTYAVCLAVAGSNKPQRRRVRSLLRNPRKAFIQCLDWRLEQTGQTMTEEEKEERWRLFRQYATSKGVEM